MVTLSTRGIWGKAPRFPPMGLQPLDSYAHHTYCLESVKPHEWARSGKARFSSHSVGRGRYRVRCPVLLVVTGRKRVPGSAREESHGVVQFGCSPRTHDAYGGGRPCARCESEGHPDLGRCREDPVLSHVWRSSAVPALRGPARDRRASRESPSPHGRFVGSSSGSVRGSAPLREDVRPGSGL